MFVPSLNWYVGWCLILAAFVTGAALGLYFHRDDFLGGYNAFRRRILRLGHIALAALGMINVLYGLTPGVVAGPTTMDTTVLGTTALVPALRATVASAGFIVGGITMPAVCFLSAWRTGCRHLFFIPVGALVVAVIQTLRVGLP